MAPFHLPPIPSVAEYKRAFRQIKHDISPKQRLMLDYLYNAPNHTMTATELADAVGYKNFRGTNLQIGKLGYKLREALDYWDEGGQVSYVIAYFIPPGAQGNTDWLFVMHEEVAQAIKEIGGI